MEELWCLDDDLFKFLQPIHGLIFLFKWVADDEPAGTIVMDESRLEKIFFAKQVINNACATQAILSVLMNAQHPDIILGSTLTDLKEFCMSFDAFNKGLTLSNASQIRTVHNSFARQTLFELDNKNANKDEDLFHFVGYVPIDGRLYELDGLKEGPIDLGPCSAGQEWLKSVRPIIEKRIKKYSEGEIHFNLMAIVSDRQMLYQKTIEELTALSTDDESRVAEIERLNDLIQEDLAKKKKYKIENIRRKHNYLPLIVEILKMLGEKGQLTPLYEKAKQRAVERATKAK